MYSAPMMNDTNTMHDKYYAAIDADNAWQAELNRLKIDRYSKAARGDEGSELRRLYEVKIAADEARHAAARKFYEG